MYFYIFLLARSEVYRLHIRAVDSPEQPIDFLLIAKRDAAALSFFRKAIRHGEPKVITIDKSEAHMAVLAALNVGKSKDDAITVRQQKYLHNLVEQDHRHIKRHIIP